MTNHTPPPVTEQPVTRERLLELCDMFEDENPFFMETARRSFTRDTAAALRELLDRRSPALEPVREIAALSAELDAVRADTARLDWLDAQVAGYASPTDPYEHEGNSWSLSGQFTSIRDAIDYGRQNERCPTCGKPEPHSCGMCSDAALPVQARGEK